jgi:hypothetical protein
MGSNSYLGKHSVDQEAIMCLEHDDAAVPGLMAIYAWACFA